MNTTMPMTKARGAVHKNKEEAKPVLCWFPLDLLAALDAAVVAEDSDRSKLIRKAIRLYLPPNKDVVEGMA